MSNVMSDHKVIIVGAGISGLCAAKWLVKTGVEVIVLEAADKVGGRLHTIRNDKVGYTDVGGAYMGPTQDRVLQLAADLGIQTYAVYGKDDIVHYREGKITRFKGTYMPMSGRLFRYFDENNMYRLIDKLGEQIPCDKPWDAPNAEELDKMTFLDWCKQNIYTKSIRDAAEQFCRMNLTAESHEVSLLWVLWYVKCAGGTSRINSTKGGAQERKCIGGAQQLPQRIADNLGIGTRVLLEKPVVKIEQSDKGVIVQTLDGSLYKGDYVIVATAPSVQRRIIFSPPLPPSRNQLISKYPTGTVIKTMAFYKEPYWRQKGFNGGIFVDDDDINFPIENAFDDCKPDGSYPCIIGFIVCNKARKLYHLSKDERMKVVAAQYAKLFGVPEMAEPVHYEERNWASDPWTAGCYTGYLPPGVLTQCGKEIRTPIGRTYFAGTETATKWTGYMDGAIEAGERAAREVLYDMGIIHKNEIWQVQPQVVPVPSFDRTFVEKYAPSLKGLVNFSCTLTAATLSVIGGFLIYRQNIRTGRLF